jgi:MFS family permease
MFTCMTWGDHDGPTGFSHKATASLLGVFYIGAAIGVLLGGWMGDKIERILPGKGRIMCAQFSSFMAVPTSFFLLVLLPQDAHKWALFAEIFLLMGLTITWCQSCANNPISSFLTLALLLRHLRSLVACSGSLSSPLQSALCSTHSCISHMSRIALKLVPMITPAASNTPI